MDPNKQKPGTAEIHMIGTEIRWNGEAVMADALNHVHKETACIAIWYNDNGTISYNSANMDNKETACIAIWYNDNGTISYNSLSQHG